MIVPPFLYYFAIQFYSVFFFFIKKVTISYTKYCKINFILIQVIHNQNLKLFEVKYKFISHELQWMPQYLNI